MNVKAYQCDTHTYTKFSYFYAINFSESGLKMRLFFLT
jgi:hypothetical protein